MRASTVDGMQKLNAARFDGAASVEAWVFPAFIRVV